MPAGSHQSCKAGSAGRHYTTLKTCLQLPNVFVPANNRRYSPVRCGGNKVTNKVKNQWAWRLILPRPFYFHAGQLALGFKLAAKQNSHRKADYSGTGQRVREARDRRLAEGGFAPQPINLRRGCAAHLYVGR